MEPFPGWVDNFNGPMGLLVGGGTGLIRTLYADTKLETEYMPVDNIVKLLIVGTWNKGISRDANTLSIQQGSKYNHPQFYVGAYIDIGRELLWEDPFENKIWYPDGSLTTNWLYYFINVLLFHMVPAFFLDIGLKMTGQKPRLFKTQRKIYIANMAVKHFSLNEWHFVNDEACKLLKKIPSKETKDFNFDIMPADYQSLKEFYRQCSIFVKVNFLKENRSVTKRNSIITKMMYVMHKSIKTTCYVILIWSLFFKINIIELINRKLLGYWNGLE
ncbi:unnamed protein product [Ceutorhynchus assimilis]|uniref:Fatty acyl-CoA reductase n=1 Tax=Ceutorhynchus assimilis TaxID=467358 RepID=A0A9N9QR98_9CUCU|nr:unnamed protein product [Ceutorhynchus assimilis]